MSELLPIWTIAIIAITSVCSFIGFQNTAFCENNLFSVREILVEKQYRRLITSAFLHADWSHLFLNMFSLYLFGRQIEFFFGAGNYLLIYFAAIIGGDLLSLRIHRNHEYRAYGASGGVCGIIFSYIYLFPGASIASFPLPIGIPGWLYAILFFVGSFLALKRQKDNIGHDAHLGGAIIGMWTSVALNPNLLAVNWQIVTAISILAGLLFLYLSKNPLLLPLLNFLPARRQAAKKRASENNAAALDAVLEKISRSGIQSLTPHEKRLLESTSEKYRRRSDSEKPQSDLII